MVKVVDLSLLANNYSAIAFTALCYTAMSRMNRYWYTAGEFKTRECFKGCTLSLESSSSSATLLARQSENVPAVFEATCAPVLFSPM